MEGRWFRADVIAPPPEQQQHLESNRRLEHGSKPASQLQNAIERGLKARGLVQASDPATADFLVDYHVAVKTQTATVAAAIPAIREWLAAHLAAMQDGVGTSGIRIRKHPLP